MRILTYFLLIGLLMNGFGLLIKPHFANEIIWGIFMPWIISSLEVFILHQVFNKEVLQTTKVLIYGFIIKMILFGGFLLIIFNFYSFNTVAFVFSFLASFLSFHTLEAIYLKLLFDGKKI